MKTTRKNEWILLATCLLGAAGCWLRHMILTDGIDAKGLLISGHPCTLGLWVLSLGYLAAAFVIARGQKISGGFRVYFPPCKIRGILGMAGGGIIGLYSAVELLGGNFLPGILGLLAGICMIFTGRCRCRGRHPSPMFHVVVCLFFIVRLVLSFKNWSADPQVQDYVIQLLACVSLMMFAYHRASFDANQPTPKRTAFFGLCAVFFAVIALSDKAMWLFMLGSGIWSVGACPTLEPVEPDRNDQPAREEGGSQIPEELLAEIAGEELEESFEDAFEKDFAETLEEVLSMNLEEEAAPVHPEEPPALENFDEPDPKLIAELFARLPLEEQHPWA